MYHVMKERGLKLPLISHDKYFKLTIRRPSAVTTSDTVHDATHDLLKPIVKLPNLNIG